MSELHFRILLNSPTPGVDFGLQQGQGNTYETIQKQRSATTDLAFTFSVEVKKNKEGQPDFRGPLVQGPVQERFVYIGIGTYAGQQGTEWSRRLKVPFRNLTWDSINKALADPQLIFEIHIPGTGKDGGPPSGTVKPFDGWTLVRR